MTIQNRRVSFNDLDLEINCHPEYRSSDSKRHSLIIKKIINKRISTKLYVIFEYMYSS